MLLTMGLEHECPFNQAGYRTPAHHESAPASGTPGRCRVAATQEYLTLAKAPLILDRQARVFRQNCLDKRQSHGGRRWLIERDREAKNRPVRHIDGQR